MGGPFTVALAPPPGLDSDDSTFKAQGRWADGSNIRFYNGAPQSLGAYSTAVTVTGLGEIVTELAVFQATGLGGGTYVLIGTRDALLVSAALGAASGITPAGLGIGHNIWSFAPYGNTAICSPAYGPIYQYTFGGGAAAAVTNAPTQNLTVLTARRQILAFGTNEEISGTFNAKCIRGSDIENPTVWTTTATNNAFEDVLEDEGTIVAARLVGDYIGVWTSTGLWMGTYVGDPSQAYRWDRVAGAVGCTGANAVCVEGAFATWFAPDLQLWQWSPGSIPVPVPCPISRAFVANLDDTSLIRVVSLPHFNEIWVIYTSPSSFDGWPDSYIAFNKQGQWFKGALQRTAVVANGLASAMIRSSFGDPAASGAFLASQGATVYAHELSDGTFPAWSITSADQYLAEGRRRTMITRFVPDFTDSAGTISLTLSMRNRPQSTPVSKGPYSIAVGAKKVDFRASGMIASATFSGASFVRFGKPTFDCVETGGR